MGAKSLQDLYLEKLKDLYSAERQILTALPKMIEKTTNAELRQGFEDHLAQSEIHVQRLELLCQELGVSPKGKKCVGMEGIIEDGNEDMKEVDDPQAMDALLISAAQAVEHYEIAGYGTARTWARMIGMDAHADVLQTTLDEEEETDQRLTTVAESMVNAMALEGGDREVQRSASRESNASNSGGARRSSTSDEARN